MEMHALVTPRIEHVVRQEEAAAALKGRHRRRREEDVFAAYQVERIDRTGHFLCCSCASLAEWGEANGLAGREARTLAAAGRALKLRPALEEEVLSGKLSLEAVAALGRVFENPDLVKDEADWLKCAEQWSVRKLQREIRKKEREAEGGGPVSVLMAILTAAGRALFERARILASRKKKKNLSEGEAVEVLAEHYLESFDPDRKEPRKRRMPDTTGRPGRTVPEEVKRAVRARPHGDRCAVPGCDNEVFLDYAHKQPHWDGGSREEWNLHRLCPPHNGLYDAGKLQITGPPDRPVFHFADGRVVEGFGPPTPGEAREEGPGREDERRPREGAPRDGEPREEAPREQAPRDGEPREKAPRAPERRDREQRDRERREGEPRERERPEPPWGRSRATAWRKAVGAGRRASCRAPPSPA